MKRPRDVAKYGSAAIAARGLREVADEIERNAEVYPLVKWSLNLSNWNPEWEKIAPKIPGPAVCAASVYEGKSFNASDVPPEPRA